MDRIYNIINASLGASMVCAVLKPQVWTGIEAWIMTIMLLSGWAMIFSTFIKK